MPRLQVDLQDGFAHDDVAIWVDDRQAFHDEDLTTRLVLGLAGSFEVEVAQDPVTVRVEIRSRGASAVREVRVDQTPYVGVSLAATMVSVHVSRTPFAYL